MIASYFWSAGAGGMALTVGVALVAGALGIGLGYLIHRMTAAGVEMAPPADGAEVTAEPGQTGAAGGSAGPDRAAPAPGAPVGRAGAPGVTPLPDPDPYDQDQDPARVAAAALGQDPTDQVEWVRRRAVDYLANAQLSEDETTALAWEDRARHLLADELVAPELIELLIDHMQDDAALRAQVLLAGAERVAGGGR